jgi:hypothetical protein
MDRERPGHMARVYLHCSPTAAAHDVTSIHMYVRGPPRPLPELSLCIYSQHPVSEPGRIRWNCTANFSEQALHETQTLARSLRHAVFAATASWVMTP